MRLIGILAAAALACTLAGCVAPQQQQPDHSQLKVNDAGVSSDGGAQGDGAEEGVSSAEEAKPTASELRAKLDITEDYRSDFNHGEKGASYQKYIVLHDTEVDGSGANCAAASGIEGNKESPALTLYAQWNKLVTVSFDLCGHGGANISSQTFVSGNKASEPTAPKEDGWVFGGWYTEKGCQYRFSFDSAVTSDITLYAKWDRVTTVVSAPVATPTPSPAPVATPTPSPAAAATKTATVKNAAIPQTSDVFPMEGLLALLAVGAVGFGAAGWLRKKHH